MKIAKYVVVSCLALSSFLFAAIDQQKSMQTPEQALVTLTKTIDEVVELMALDDGKNTVGLKRQVVDKTVGLFDFNRITALAVGFAWKNASSSQKVNLSREFKHKLINAYYQALVHVKDAKVKTNPNPIIKSNGREIVIQSKATSLSAEVKDPISIDYFLYKAEQDYKIYNINVQGVSLVTAYRGRFTEIIQEKGIDGLIEALKADNDKHKPISENQLGDKIQTIKISELDKFRFNFCSDRKLFLQSIWISLVLNSKCQVVY